MQKEKSVFNVKNIVIAVLAIAVIIFVFRECSAKTEKAESPLAEAIDVDVSQNVVELPPVSPESDVNRVAPQPPQRTTTPTVTTTPTISQNLASSQYKGVISGDWGMTIDEQSRLVYYCKNNLHQRDNLDRNTVHLNGEDGTPGEVVGDYYIFKTNIVVDLTNINIVRTWAVFIGYNTQDGWDKWIPYEWVTRVDPSLGNNPKIIAANNGYHFRTELSLQKK